MRKTIFLFVLLGLTHMSIAQFKFGVRAGVSSSSIKAKDVVVDAASQNYDQLKLQAGDAKMGIHAGLFARVHLLGMFIQPEALISSTGGEITLEQIKNNQVVYSSTVVQRFTRLDVPVMMGYRLGLGDIAGVRFQAGPSASILLKETTKDDYLKQPEGLTKKATWGFQAGVGVDVWKFAIDLKYEGNFSKLGTGFTYDGNQDVKFDTRNSQLVLSIGYFFFDPL